jgi:hypothetical protein
MNIIPGVERGETSPLITTFVKNGTVIRLERRLDTCNLTWNMIGTSTQDLMVTFQLKAYGAGDRDRLSVSNTVGG